MLLEVPEPWGWRFSDHEGAGRFSGRNMATGEGGDNGHMHSIASAEVNLGAPKSKKTLKAAASFFTPLSKKTKVAPEVEADKSIAIAEERKDEDFQDSTASSVLATIFEKRPSRKKAKVGQDQKREVEVASPLLDAQTEGSQPHCSLEQEQEVALSPTKKQSRASPAKKKRKAPQNVIDSKPSVGVHGPDLFLQARLAAEENARLSAGKATHPFFARPKAGGARSLVTDEAAHNLKGRSLTSASDCDEKALRLSPLKPPHPFFARQNLGGVKVMTVDESPSNYESDYQPPSLPFHVTQNMPEEGIKLAWYPNWTWRNLPVKADGEKSEGIWSFSSYQPSYTWTWPSSENRERRGRSISRVAAFGRVIAYLTGKEAGTQYLLGEEVESVAAVVTQKLVEKFSSYYYRYARKDSFEQNLVLQPLVERQFKDANSSRNPLWTDHYQPQTSQEVCGNKENVRTLSSWLQSWGEKILQQKCAVKNKEAAEGSSSDNDSDFEDSPSETDDTDDLHNCVLVTGPVGCGKSAAIYACAIEQGFTVIEVNASECRSGALIKHKFKEAMESHGLSKRHSSTPTDASDGQEDTEQVLKQGETCRRSISFYEESENQLSLSQSANRSSVTPPSLRGLRVILFEDVDIVFEEDSGFMGALALLAKTSKCPIIFSSNSRKPVLPQVRELQSVRFEQPSTAELVAHAYMVCLAEGVSCNPDIVEHIVKTSGHDLRKLFMLLQFWTQGSSSDTGYLKDTSDVEDLGVLHTDKPNPNLVNCLLQLDGCPQVPATRLHPADKKSNEKLSIIKSEYVYNEQKPRNDSEKTTIYQEPGPTKIFKSKSLDSDWLYAHDCQHRVLPLIFPNTELCQVTAMVSNRLEYSRQRLLPMTDYGVAAWSRDRFVKLKAKADSESKARKALQKLQAAARKDENGTACSRPPDDFSFMKLMQSSYDSPAAQTASNECTKDTLSLLQENERRSSEEREDDFTPSCLLPDEDMRDLHPSGVTTNGMTLESDECTKLLPLLDMSSRSSPETGWMLRVHNHTPGLHSDAPPFSMTDLGVGSCQERKELSAAARAQSQHTNFALESSLPLGLEETPSEMPVREGAVDPTPIPISNLTIHHDEETPSSAGEQPFNQGISLEDTILNVTSTVMQQTWSELRSLNLQQCFSQNLDVSILLDDILHDLSACDFLSSRTASEYKHLRASTEQRGSGFDDSTACSSGDNCTEAAAVLAQLRLNQVLNKISPLNGLFSDTWQVGPSILQHEAVREEKRACQDECVDLLLPLRCRLSGRLARLDYISFHCQLTHSSAGSERTGRATRQRKLT